MLNARRKLKMEFDKVKEIIAEQMGISEDDITMETSFEDLGADSLDIFQIISELEEAFDMEFANDDAEKIKTVGDAVEYVKNAAK
jgi:acyl carrier protein